MSINVKFDEFDSKDVHLVIVLHCSPIQHTSTDTRTHREMHVCIILLLLLPLLLLLLLLFISRFISGFGCRYTRSVRKKWNVDVKQNRVNYTISQTDIVHYEKLLWRFMREKGRETDWCYCHHVAVAMISYAFHAQVSTNKMNISNLCVFFYSLFFFFVCLFVLLAIHELFFPSIKFEYLITKCKKTLCQCFAALYLEILGFYFGMDLFIDEIEWLKIRHCRFHIIIDTNIYFIWLSNIKEEREREKELRNSSERDRERERVRNANAFI